MKNIILVILSILMVISLTACAGNSGKSPEISTPDNKPAPSTNESSAESSGNPSNEPADSKHDDSKPDDTVTGKKCWLLISLQQELPKILQNMRQTLWAQIFMKLFPNSLTLTLTLTMATRTAVPQKR